MEKELLLKSINKNANNTELCESERKESVGRFQLFRVTIDESVNRIRTLTASTINSQSGNFITLF